MSDLAARRNFAFRPSPLVLSLGVTVAAVTLLGGILAGRSTEAVATSSLAAVAALATVLLVERAPRLAFGLLFLVASLSRITIDLPFGHVRLEQPAILGAFGALVLLGRLPRPDRRVLAIGLCFGAYLAIMVIASLLEAPALAVSARLLVWTAISMLGAVVAYALLVGDAGEPGIEQRLLAWVGGGQAAVGLVIAVAFLTLGPTGIPGMQLSPGEVPKVASVDFEANLYASLLAMLAPFALEEWRRTRTSRAAAAALVILAALGLGVTRGAYLGVAAGLVVYVGLLAARSPRRALLGPVVAVAVVGLVLAPVTSAVLLPVERTPGPAPTPTASAASSGATAGGSPSPSPSPSPTPTPQPTPTADTLAFRLDRVPAALADIKAHPIIGLGAATFGQRHARSDAPDTPDYIGMLALVAVYESGILGTLALSLGFLLLLALLVTTVADVGRAAAYAGAVVSFLVSYEATNALWFSINWLLIGAALAL
ncbi:MAG TPA: O-antigen ligase family protein, partial [Candidatus Limnocylindrales bacterium]